MDIRRAMPVVLTEDPVVSRAFYESLLGFRVAADEDGMMMFASTTIPVMTSLTSLALTRPSNSIQPRRDGERVGVQPCASFDKIVIRS